MGSRLGRFAARWIFAAVLTGWSMTVGLASYRSRLLLSVIVEHLGWERFLGEGVNPRLPSTTMGELFDGRLATPILFPTYRDGNAQTVEVAVINELVRRRLPSVLFEIGTFDGRTTSNLAASSPGGAVVYTLDLPIAEKPDPRTISKAETRSTLGTLASASASRLGISRNAARSHSFSVTPRPSMTRRIGAPWTSSSWTVHTTPTTCATTRNLPYD